MLKSPFGKSREKMERRGVFFFVILFHILHLVQAQSQEGFISLSCGLFPNDSPYEDPTNGLTYTSDADFIQSGKAGRNEYYDDDSPITERLRYFPEGVRNCYNLNVTQGMRYMIKATFGYGNYDGLDEYPAFDLYLGPNLWTKVNTSGYTMIVEEVIHVMQSNSLHVCLVKTGTSTPMINVLELRPLRTDLYVTERKSVRVGGRICFGADIGLLRYPNDIYDRQWFTYTDDTWTSLNTTHNVNSSSYNLPKSLMAKAATPRDVTKSFNITMLASDSSITEVYLYMHFAELQDLEPNQTRKFFLLMDGQPILKDPYIPKYLTIESVQQKTPLNCNNGYCNFELVKTWDSFLPPLMNAMEVFYGVDFSLLETNGDDVNAIKKIQSSYRLNKISWQGDPCVPSKFMWDGLKCNSFDNSTPAVITFLNLSSNSLNGTINPSIQNLTNLQELDLSNNNLTGGVPEFLANMKSLLVINLSSNKLKGPIPNKLVEKKGLKLNVEGNPKIVCTTGSCVNIAKEGDSKKNIIVPIAALISLVVILLVASIICCAVRKKKKPSIDEEPTSCMLTTDGRSSSRSSKPEIMTKNKRFAYSEVKTMTKNFQRILGKGGFGIVYYGSVNGSEEVAVKMLSQSSSQGYKQFKAEVELLLRVHHKNLVGLVGYCDEGDKLALIYEYMANGDLDEHMSGKRGGAFLNWATRLKIVAESAQGLEYLHNGCKPLMVHRDIKTTNILLNEHLQAKLADFGLSRSFPTEGDTHVSTCVAGTIGYLDPEYYRTNWLTEKSDVYSFGIVILEIITNKPVIDPNREKRHIAEWVGQMLSNGDIKSITDESLHGDYNSGSVWKAVELAMSCLNPSSTNRPTMTQVVSELNECLALENLRGGESQEMDSQASVEAGINYSIEANPMAR